MKYKKITKDKCIRVRLDETQLDKLERYCLVIDTNKSNFVRALLMSYMSDLELDARNDTSVSEAR